MSNESIFADNVILEVGDVVGKKDISTPIFTTTWNNVTSFNNDCEPPSWSDNYAFPAGKYLHERKNNLTNGHMSYDPNIIFVGDIGEGCSQTQTTCQPIGIDFEPINKCMIMQMWWHQSPTPNMLNQIGTGAYNDFQSNGSGMVNGVFALGNNHSDYPKVVDGRCLYMKNTKTGNTLCFDIISSMDSDTLLLKGIGTTNVNQLAALDPDLAAGEQCFEWYISGYQHSGEWDESQGDFRWDSEGKGTTMSYEGQPWNNKNNRGFNQGDSFFGVRNNWLSNEVDYANFAVITLNVASITNARITIFSGSHPDPMYNTINYDPITAPGVYKFCVPRLMPAGKWSLDVPDANDGSVNTMFGGIPYCAFEGSVGLFRANVINPKGAGYCIINSISVELTEADITVTNTPTTTQTGTNVFGEVDDIEWNWLDVLESQGVPFSLNFSVGDLRDISKRSTGFSKTFNIPASNHNNGVLTPMLAVGSERKMISWMPARIKVNGVYVFLGLMRVEEGNTGKGGFFKCHIIQDGVDWTTALDKSKLCDLPISHTEDRNYTNIKNSWNNSVDNGDEWFWGLVNYGEWYGEHVNTTGTHDYSHGANDFHPTLFAKPIVDKIFASIGYTVHSNFFNSPIFKALCHPYSSGEDYVDTEGIFGDSGDNYCRVTRTAKVAPGGSYWSGGKVHYPCMTCSSNYAYWKPLNTSGAVAVSNDIGNNFSTNTSVGYTVPFTGTYHVFIGATMYLSQGGSSGSYSELAVRVLKNGSYLVGGILTPGMISPQFGINSGCYVYSNDTDVDSGISRSSDGDFFLNAGDNITVEVAGRNGVWLWHSYHDIENLVFDIYPIPSATVPSLPATIDGSILPCTKQVDYLKGLTELFNLQWTTNEETKTIYCEPYDDFFGSGKVVDWTKKLDYNSWNDKYIVEQLAKEIIFEYKEDTGCKATDSVYRYKEAQEQQVYKSHIEQNQEKFRKETLVMGTKVFYATIMSNAYGTAASPGQWSGWNNNNMYKWGDLTWNEPTTNDNNPVIPYMWSEEGGGMNNQNRPPYNPSPKFNIRILNYYGAQTCSSWKFVDHNGTSHTQTKYPFIGWKNQWLKGIAEDPLSLSWGNDNDSNGFTSPGLFNKYWQNAYDKMNGGAALRTCMMNLTPVDIAIFDYRDLIYMEIDDVATYWTVNKIVDYKPNQQVLTKVELIEWKHSKDANRKGGGSSAKRNAPSETTEGENPPSNIVIRKNRDNGLVFDNNTNNNSRGTGIAIGMGVVAENNQTVLGRYNQQNTDDVLQIGTGSNHKLRNTAFAVTQSGEVEIHGGELVVEETDGLIHDLAYIDEYGDIKKVYLKKEEKTSRHERSEDSFKY